MNCFVCALEGKVGAAVGLCENCSVALCLTHLAEARSHRVGGTRFACPHRSLPPVGAREHVPEVQHASRR